MEAAKEEIFFILVRFPLYYQYFYNRFSFANTFRALMFAVCRHRSLLFCNNMKKLRRGMPRGVHNNFMIPKKEERQKIQFLLSAVPVFLCLCFTVMFTASLTNTGSFRIINLHVITVHFIHLYKKQLLLKPQAPKANQCHSRLHLLHSQFKNKSKKPISDNLPWYYHTDVLLVPGQPGLMKMHETGWLFARHFNMVQVHIIDNR